MKEFKYSRHAKNRMRLHKISEDEVEECLTAPELQEKSIHGRVNRWKKVRDRYLRVTIKEEANKVIIVTAVMKKHMGGKQS